MPGISLVAEDMLEGFCFRELVAIQRPAGAFANSVYSVQSAQQFRRFVHVQPANLPICVSALAVKQKD